MFRSTILSLGLAMAAGHPLYGAYATASASCSATPPNTTTVTQATFTPGQVVSASLTSPSNCLGQAEADFGVLKVSATTDSSDFVSDPAPGTYANVYANFQVDFFLFDSSLPANSVVHLYVPIDYSVTLVANPASGASNLSSLATYGLSYDGVYNQVVLSSSSDNYGGNTCPNPSSGPKPWCNGTYQGTTGIVWDFTVNSTGGPNIFRLWTNVSASNGLSDAFHTTTVGAVVLPVTTTFAYANGSAGAGGNAMGFASAAPEPSTFALAGVVGLALVAFGRRRR